MTSDEGQMIQVGRIVGKLHDHTIEQLPFLETSDLILCPDFLTIWGLHSVTSI